MTEAGDEWAALARPERSPGAGMRLLSATLPGVRRVRGQVEDYARAWDRHNRYAVAGPGCRWVVLGDSLAQGVGATAHDAGWVGQLAARLRASGTELSVVNLSATGARVGDLLDVQLPAMRSLPAQGPGAPTPLVTVVAGSNDLFGGRDARGALPQAMADVVSQLPPDTVVATLPQPVRAARLANLSIEAAAESGRIRLVDMRRDGPSSWRGRLAGDWFHPNDAGYAAIADALEPAVRAVLAAP